MEAGVASQPDSVSFEDFLRFARESRGLHRRHLRDARINSASLLILELQVKRVNKNLNAVLRHRNRWARFMRVHHPVRKIGRKRKAVVDVVDRVAVPDRCGDGESDVEN